MVIVGAALARPTRWSSLAVASNIVGQLGLLVVTGKWPLRPQPKTPCGASISTRGKTFSAPSSMAHTCSRPKMAICRAWLPQPASTSISSCASSSRRCRCRRSRTSWPQRSYVKERLGDEVLPAVVWVGDDVGELFAAKLPAGRYVLKANHGWNCEPVPEPARRPLCQARRNRAAGDELAHLSFRLRLGRVAILHLQAEAVSGGIHRFQRRSDAGRLQVLLFSRQGSVLSRSTSTASRTSRSAFYTPDWKLHSGHLRRGADPARHGRAISRT